MKEFVKLNVNMDSIFKNMRRLELNRKIVNTALNIQCKCLCCNKNCQKTFDNFFFQKKLANTYKFSNHDINTFILLLREDSYEYVDNLEELGKNSLLEKETVYNQ